MGNYKRDSSKERTQATLQLPMKVFKGGEVESIGLYHSIIYWDGIVISRLHFN